ncbi:hypothetical protein N0V84_000031 [Fusarium piperis]|uniref:Uncharacterized protein n=1 Tax=Fusarium piperis TaxID=1435070 RepID=A0A9W8WNR3_9HYPO|nr:hypothetical protein N0V84_000031 [Fusarium piperis]
MPRDGVSTSSLGLLKWSCSEENKKCQKIIQSSFNDITKDKIFSETNGFVNAAWQAYSDHHHLHIRPEDVWFSILTQLNFYINKNAEKLRSHFVAHEGKKEVEVCVKGSIETVNIGKLAVIMTKKMEEHIVDPELRKWVMPDFTTTEATDKVTAAILMMASMQSYFSIYMCLACGLPSVTLLGTRDDWCNIRSRIDKIPQFGEEAEQFTKLLRPVLDRFVRSFDNPEDPDILDFWGKIVHWETNGSGPSYLSGWITAFCFWTAKGDSLHRIGLVEAIATHVGCNIDGVQFHRVETTDIPEGFASVPVKLNNQGTEINTMMVAGSVGVRVWSSQDPKPEIQQETKKEEENKLARLREFATRIFCLWGQDSEGSASKESPDRASAVKEPSDTAPKPQVPQGESGPILDSVQPVSGWWMYELKAGEE